MKKITTTFFLLLMLFNMAGYRLFFAVMEKKATQKTEAMIDAGGFDATNLVEIKIPLHMPYYTDKAYEMAYGETVIDGKHYRYVKRKIVNNILFLLCVPNAEKTNLIIAKKAIEKSNSNATDENPLQKNKQCTIIKLPQAEFIQNYDLAQSDKTVSMLQSFTLLHNTTAGNLFVPLTPAQPPEYYI